MPPEIFHNSNFLVVHFKLHNELSTSFIFIKNKMQIIWSKVYSFQTYSKIATLFKRKIDQRVSILEHKKVKRCKRKFIRLVPNMPETRLFLQHHSLVTAQMYFNLYLTVLSQSGAIAIHKWNSIR